MLQIQMHNGATVSDWLGTAAVAARVAAGHIEAVREDRTVDAVGTLTMAETDLVQALDELRQVKAHVANVNAYGTRQLVDPGPGPGYQEAPTDPDHPGYR